MECEEIIGEYEDHFSVTRIPENSTESLFTECRCFDKWRRAPRNPSFFSDCNPSVSSFKESDYDTWLAQYYDDLYKQEIRDKYIDKETATDNPNEPISLKLSSALSIFPSKESTKYWGIEEPRRHWPITKTTKEYLLFPSIHPLLNVSTRYGRYISMLHSASAVLEVEYKKRISSIFKLNLIRARIFSYQLAKLILCDNLASLSWFDPLTKKVVITTICQLLRNQRKVEIVTLENANLKQLEGIVILCALSRNCGGVIKKLNMWKMFAYGQCPVLTDSASLAACSRSNRTQAVDLKYHFLEILNSFTSLTHLSINYAYLANRDGDTILRFGTILHGCLQELRFLCVPEERPLLTNPDYGVGGYQITDGVWRRVRELNPKLRVMFAFVHMPEYENIILFLSKSIPLSSFYVSSGIDLSFRSPWEIDSTLLELRNWYASTLDTLCLHLWRHRDLLDYVVEYKILDEFPNLKNFEYIGVLKCLSTLNGFCRRLLTGSYKLQQLLLWVEEINSSQKLKKTTTEKIAEINKIYLPELQNLGIDAQIKTFPL